ncbi:MAG: argininosuccinate lyase [archaeon]
MKLWQNKSKLNKKIEEFTVGNDFLLDKKLVKYDCIASIAHAKMLKKIKVLNKKECSKIIEALNEIIKLDSKGKFLIKLDDEDCHTAIENHLVKKLGSTGKKIHFARSRNDQVLTALRLYCRKETEEIIELIEELIKELVLFKGKYGETKMPGYTHMRKAMPSSVGLWSESFIESMKDNKKLTEFVMEQLNQNPLGTGAGYGVPNKIDRKLTTELLGFKKIQKNPIYVQNSRGKLESSLIHALNQTMFDLNKMASDLILFSMEEFGYFRLAAEICTGSSMMPHKKNPDALELLRAKYHYCLSCEFQLKTLISNLPSGYNRDLQLTKEPLIKAIETAKESLKIMKLILKKVEVNEHECLKGITKEMYSTKKAIELARKGIPFREAHSKISGEIFYAAAKNN